MPTESESRTPSEEPRLLSREFLLLLASVSFFGFSWSFYLILPKFFTTELGMDAASRASVRSQQPRSSGG